MAGTLVFLLLGIGLAVTYAAAFENRRALKRRYSEVMLQVKESDQPQSQIEDEGPNKAMAALDWAAAQMPASTNAEAVAKLSTSLTRAGFVQSSALRLFRAVKALSLVGGLVLGFIGGVMFAHTASALLLAGLAGGGIGFYAPTYYINKRGKKRQAEIAHQLSDILDLLVVCVEAGLGLFEAIRIVGEETERHGQAIGRELMLVAGEISAGAGLGQALRNLADRTDVEDVRPLAATLIQSEQLGAQMAPALRASSDSLRTHRRLRAEEAAQKSTIKILFPLVLFVLPAMLIAILAPALIQAIHTMTN